MGNRREKDFLSVPLEDTALLEEVELLSRLIVAANEFKGPLGDEAVDALLAEPTQAENHRPWRTRPRPPAV